MKTNSIFGTADAIKLADERTDELLKSLGERVPREVQADLRSGLKTILRELMELHSRWHSDANEFLSTADAATLLFVSRPYLAKLIVGGELTFHHSAANEIYVTKCSVLKYQTARQDAANAYNSSLFKDGE